ncbi:MAG: hypothetical protein AB4206_04615 [Xenococcaceae cyanobacterium]
MLSSMFGAFAPIPEQEANIPFGLFQERDRFCAKAIALINFFLNYIIVSC